MIPAGEVGRPAQVVAVTGGKGGVGKTSVSINLSIALAQLGRRVVLLDADLGLANVDVLARHQHLHALSTRRTARGVKHHLASSTEGERRRLRRPPRGTAESR